MRLSSSSLCSDTCRDPPTALPPSWTCGKTTTSSLRMFLAINTSRQYDDKDDNIDPSVPKRYRGTAIDKRDMRVLGKTQVLRVRLFVNYAHHQTDCLCSATSSSSPCWALLPLSWPVGKSCCRKDTPPICSSRLTHVTDCLLSSSLMVVPHCSFGA